MRRPYEMASCKVGVIMFTIEEIARATGGAIIGEIAGGVTGVSSDSRTVLPGELFIPLRGERFDGHDFIQAASDRGVRVFLADSAWIADHTVPAGATVAAHEAVKGRK